MTKNNFQYPMLQPKGRYRSRLVLSLFAVAAALLSGMAGGVTMAYLSGQTEEYVNTVTAGSVSVRLQENSWDPESAQNLHPGEETAKDPAVTNTGKNSAWIFLEVKTPVKEISIVDPDGEKADAAPCELFYYQADTSHWMLLSEEQTDTFVQRIYGYRDLLAPGKTTEPLFSSVRIVSYLEGELDEQESLTIEIQADAIQENPDAENDSLKEIYQSWLRQVKDDRTASRQPEEKDRERRRS